MQVPSRSSDSRDSPLLVSDGSSKRKRAASDEYHRCEGDSDGGSQEESDDDLDSNDDQSHVIRQESSDETNSAPYSSEDEADPDAASQPDSDHSPRPDVIDGFPYDRALREVCRTPAPADCEPPGNNVRTSSFWDEAPEGIKPSNRERSSDTSVVTETPSVSQTFDDSRHKKVSISGNGHYRLPFGFTKAMRIEDAFVVTLIGVNSLSLAFAAMHLTDSNTKVIFSGQKRQSLDRIVASLLTLMALHNSSGPELRNRITLNDDVVPAVRHASLVQDMTPEDALKKSVLWAEIEKNSQGSAMFWSCTDTISAADINQDMKEPSRLVVIHPSQNPHMLPGVEIHPSRNTGFHAIQQTAKYLEKLHKRPIVVKRHENMSIANRLSFALLREGMSILREENISTEELEYIVKTTLAPRWTASGLLGGYHADDGVLGLSRFLQRYKWMFGSACFASSVLVAAPNAAGWRDLAHAVSDDVVQMYGPPDRKHDQRKLAAVMNAAKDWRLPSRPSQHDSVGRTHQSAWMPEQNHAVTVDPGNYAIPSWKNDRAGPPPPRHLNLDEETAGLSRRYIDAPHSLGKRKRTLCPVVPATNDPGVHGRPATENGGRSSAMPEPDTAVASAHVPDSNIDPSADGTGDLSQRQISDIRWSRAVRVGGHLHYRVKPGRDLTAMDKDNIRMGRATLQDGNVVVYEIRDQQKYLTEQAEVRAGRAVWVRDKTQPLPSACPPRLLELIKDGKAEFDLTSAKVTMRRGKKKKKILMEVSDFESDQQE